MSYRFDNRSLDTFKSHIKFSTKLENYFFNRWLDICDNLDYVKVSNPRDNGVDNTGEFIESGKTSGADYMVDLKYNNEDLVDMPIEIKWVPTYGKLTLKQGDLKAYVREKAGILFIYNTSKTGLDLRLPKDYDLEKHINLIKSIEHQLNWGIMSPKQVEYFLDFSTKHGKIKSIHYMGGKPGVVLNQIEFKKWFVEEPWIDR